MAKEAVGKALADAGISYDKVEQAYAGSMYGSMGQRALYETGMTGIPVMTVANACATGSKLVDAQATTYAGKWVVNPSGGLISKGHPLGATGIAQRAELTWQLRGTAGKRQVEGAHVALQHNIGLGSACAVAVYKPASSR
jgi:acetyl-CoA acetyltransferase